MKQLLILLLLLTNTFSTTEQSVYHCGEIVTNPKFELVEFEIESLLNDCRFKENVISSTYSTEYYKCIIACVSNKKCRYFNWIDTRCVLHSDSKCITIASLNQKLKNIISADDTVSIFSSSSLSPPVQYSAVSSSSQLIHSDLPSSFGIWFIVSLCILIFIGGVFLLVKSKNN